MDADKAVVHFDLHAKRALERSGLAGRKRLLVAVSGGPDSLAMLLALCHLRGELGIELHGAHLDHGLRGEASRADAVFASETFRTLGLECTVDRADVPRYQEKHRMSLEEASREVRYEFLGRVAREQRADAIALGHTSDDQAETVLMNIIRGSGLVGLRGMQPTSRRSIGGEDALLVRPLLGISRNETVAYCRALGLKPRHDESNLSVELTRNRVRLELLPLMEELNPAVRDALARLSSSAGQGVEYLESQVDDIWDEVACRQGNSVVLHRGAFGRLPPALKALVVRRAVASLKGDLNDIQGVHADDMVRLMGGPAGRSISLPGPLRFSVGYSEGTVSLDGDGPPPLPPLDGEHPLNIPGETVVGDWRVIATLLSPPKPRVRAASVRGEPASVRGEHVEPRPSIPDGMTAHLSYDKLGSQLRIRGRRPGDRFQPLGMATQKKLQDFMVDAKVPRQLRDRVPLIVSPRGIAWVAGWRVADWAKVEDAEQRVLELRLLPL